MKVGMGLGLEIQQQGRVGMDNHKFVNMMKKTAACRGRMAKGTMSSTGDERAAGKFGTNLGDSWFASVDAVVELKKKWQFLAIQRSVSREQ